VTNYLSTRAILWWG